MRDALPHLLRDHRRRLKLSQLALAVRAGTTQRHLSYLESGRARPGRDLLQRLADGLELSLGARNQLLMSAGLLPTMTGGPLARPGYAAFRDAAWRLIDQQAPYPAMVLDGHYNLLASNRPLDHLLSLVAPLDALWSRVSAGSPQRNLLRLTFHPEGLLPVMREPERWVPAQWRRIVQDAACEELVRDISGWPHMRRWMRRPSGAGDAPALLERYVLDRQPVDLLSVFATLGAPTDIHAASLRVNLLFPANEETDRWLRAQAPA